MYKRQYHVVLNLMCVDAPLARFKHQSIIQRPVLILAQSVEDQHGIHGDCQPQEWVKVPFYQVIMRLTCVQFIYGTV